MSPEHKEETRSTSTRAFDVDESLLLGQFSKHVSHYPKKRREIMNDETDSVSELYKHFGKAIKCS